VNLASDHESIVLGGARSLPPELTDRYFALIASTIRNMRSEELTEKGLRLAVNIAINKCHTEAAP
jgi:hypothetical protein